MIFKSDIKMRIFISQVENHRKMSKMFKEIQVGNDQENAQSEKENYRFRVIF